MLRALIYGGNAAEEFGDAEPTGASDPAVAAASEVWAWAKARLPGHSDTAPARLVLGKRRSRTGPDFSDPYSQRDPELLIRRKELAGCQHTYTILPHREVASRQASNARSQTPEQLHRRVLKALVQRMMLEQDYSGACQALASIMRVATAFDPEVYRWSLQLLRMADSDTLTNSFFRSMLAPMRRYVQPLNAERAAVVLCNFAEYLVDQGRDKDALRVLQETTQENLNLAGHPKLTAYMAMVQLVIALRMLDVSSEGLSGDVGEASAPQAVPDMRDPVGLLPRLRQAYQGAGDTAFRFRDTLAETHQQLNAARVKLPHNASLAVFCAVLLAVGGQEAAGKKALHQFASDPSTSVMAWRHLALYVEAACPWDLHGRASAIRGWLSADPSTVSASAALHRLWRIVAEGAPRTPPASSNGPATWGPRDTEGLLLTLGRSLLEQLQGHGNCGPPTGATLFLWRALAEVLGPLRVRMQVPPGKWAEDELLSDRSPLLAIAAVSYSPHGRPAPDHGHVVRGPPSSPGVRAAKLGGSASDAKEDRAVGQRDALRDAPARSASLPSGLQLEGAQPLGGAVDGSLSTSQSQLAGSGEDMDIRGDVDSRPRGFEEDPELTPASALVPEPSCSPWPGEEPAGSEPCAPGGWTRGGGGSGFSHSAGHPCLEDVDVSWWGPVFFCWEHDMGLVGLTARPQPPPAEETKPPPRRRGVNHGRRGRPKGSGTRKAATALQVHPEVPEGGCLLFGEVLYCSQDEDDIQIVPSDCSPAGDKRIAARLSKRRKAVWQKDIAQEVRPVEGADDGGLVFYTPAPEAVPGVSAPPFSLQASPEQVAPLGAPATATDQPGPIEDDGAMDVGNHPETDVPSAGAGDQLAESLWVDAGGPIGGVQLQPMALAGIGESDMDSEFEGPYRPRRKRAVPPAALMDTMSAQETDGLGHSPDVAVLVPAVPAAKDELELGKVLPASAAPQLLAAKCIVAGHVLGPMHRYCLEVVHWLCSLQDTADHRATLRQAGFNMRMCLALRQPRPSKPREATREDSAVLGSCQPVVYAPEPLS